ncbi:hypothetical protein P7K49_038631 [Saguinus oedipus]|uniref:Uncharacterized protein n=1 Tax=Saguinus oedipus TaxID=9490 RepID=A0ABQ9TFT6_SAGOE|nr:hypothetical protein P7K49_038631 [Saguinus oedipus]
MWRRALLFLPFNAETLPLLPDPLRSQARTDREGGKAEGISANSGASSSYPVAGCWFFSERRELHLAPRSGRLAFLRPVSRALAPDSFRSRAPARALGEGCPQPGLPSPNPGADPRSRVDSVPQPALRFHTIRGDCTSSSAFKGPHKAAAAIKMAPLSCRKPAGEGQFAVRTENEEDCTTLARALREYPVQILPPTRPRARTCANNALSRRVPSAGKGARWPPPPPPPPRSPAPKPRAGGRAGGHRLRPELLGAALCGAAAARRGAGFSQAPRGRVATGAAAGAERDRLVAAVAAAACVPGAGGSAASPAAHRAPRFPLSRAGGFAEVSRAAGLGAGLGGGAEDSRVAGVGSCVGSGWPPGGPEGSVETCFLLESYSAGGEGPLLPPASQRAGSLASAPACRPAGPGARFSRGDGRTFSPRARAFSSLASTDFPNRPDRIWKLRLRSCTKLRFPSGNGGKRGFSGRVQR